MSSLFRRSLGAFLPVALVLALLSGVAAFVAMDRLYGELMADSLGASAAVIAAGLPLEEREVLGSGVGDVEAWARRLDAASGLRISLIRADGTVVGDSRADPATMENHAGRPEVAAALAGRAGFSRRRSATLAEELFYAARPLRDAEGRGIIGVLRVAVDLPTMSARVAPAREGFAAAIIVLAALSAVAAALFARSLSAPLVRLAAAARQMGSAGSISLTPSGDGVDEALAGLRRAAGARGPDEVRFLGSSLVSMATELEGRARAELLASRERAAILDGMSEAVFALDGRRRLRLVNRSARELFGLGELDLSRSPDFLEVVRSVDLEAVAVQCLASASRIESELALYFPGGERWFSIVATPLHGPAGSAAGEGLVLVLNDQTRLRRLERLRKDFVANVSHELRTPIQMVKGFAETLREGGHGAPEQDRWLGIIERNASRMENLIGDLLSLARLEQDGEAGLETADCAVEGLASEAIEAVESKAAAKKIPITMTIPDGLRAKVNEGLVVQALVNLLDNAVKYCPEGTPVRVEAGIEGEAGARCLVLAVADRGPGIAARHLPRLFERFYRIDGARSRELGGTGLGLAIVKHIARAHGGEASVESWEGEGTSFSLRLPFPELR